MFESCILIIFNIVVLLLLTNNSTYLDETVVHVWNYNACLRWHIMLRRRLLLSNLRDRASYFGINSCYTMQSTILLLATAVYSSGTRHRNNRRRRFELIRLYQPLYSRRNDRALYLGILKEKETFLKRWIIISHSPGYCSGSRKRETRHRSPLWIVTRIREN